MGQLPIETEEIDIVLEKREGQSLGFTVYGGIDGKRQGQHSPQIPE